MTRSWFVIWILAALGRTKRVGGNIGPQARQPLPGAPHKKRTEWGRGRDEASALRQKVEIGKIGIKLSRITSCGHEL